MGLEGDLLMASLGAILSAPLLHMSVCMLVSPLQALLCLGLEY